MFWTLFVVHLSANPLPRLVDLTFSFIRILFVLVWNTSVKIQDTEMFRVADCFICLLGCMRCLCGSNINLFVP